VEDGHRSKSLDELTISPLNSVPVLYSSSRDGQIIKKLQKHADDMVPVPKTSLQSSSLDPTVKTVFNGSSLTVFNI